MCGGDKGYLKSEFKSEPTEGVAKLAKLKLKKKKIKKVFIIVGLNRVNEGRIPENI